MADNFVLSQTNMVEDARKCGRSFIDIRVLDGEYLWMPADWNAFSQDPIIISPLSSEFTWMLNEHEYRPEPALKDMLWTTTLTSAFARLEERFATDKEACESLQARYPALSTSPNNLDKVKRNATNIDSSESDEDDDENNGFKDIDGALIKYELIQDSPPSIPLLALDAPEPEKLVKGPFYRIRALRDIPSLGVKKGDLGGLVTGPDVLSQKGACWISKNSVIYDKNARISGNARVENSEIIGPMIVKDDALVKDTQAWSRGIPSVISVSQNAKVIGSELFDSVSISGAARALHSYLQDNARIDGSAMLYRAQIEGDAHIGGNAKIRALDGSYRMLASVRREAEVTSSLDIRYIPMNPDSDMNSMSCTCYKNQRGDIMVSSLYAPLLGDALVLSTEEPIEALVSSIRNISAELGYSDEMIEHELISAMYILDPDKAELLNQKLIAEASVNVNEQDYYYDR